MSKRVLIITYYWPPTAGSGVQRWLKMSKYLPQYGWQPVIYTPENPEAGMTDESLLRDIAPEAEVIKRPILEPYAVFNALTGNKGKNSGKASTGSGAVNPINAVGHKSPLMRLSLWLRANVFVPDPRCLWIRPSVRFLKQYLREHPVDAIVSTGPPHSMHLIARALHRSTGIPWTADFRDPWTRIFYFKHLPLTRRSRKRYAAMELSVLREADHVVAVTDNMVRDFLEELDADKKRGTSGRQTAGDSSVTEQKNKFHVIENGYDEADFTGITAAELPAGFNLVHTGLFSAEGNPRRLWKVLAELCRDLPGFGRDLHLTFAGKTDPEILAAVSGRPPDRPGLHPPPRGQPPAEGRRPAPAAPARGARGRRHSHRKILRIPRRRPPHSRIRPSRQRPGAFPRRHPHRTDIRLGRGSPAEGVPDGPVHPHPHI